MAYRQEQMMSSWQAAKTGSSNLQVRGGISTKAVSVLLTI